MRIFVYDKGKDKSVLAGIWREGVFYRKCKANHFMNHSQSYCVQEEAIDKLKQLGTKEFRFDTETHGNLIIPFEKVLKYDPKDFGHGKQRHIPLHEWKKAGEQ